VIALTNNPHDKTSQCTNIKSIFQTQFVTTPTRFDVPSSSSWSCRTSSKHT